MSFSTIQTHKDNTYIYIQILTHAYDTYIYMQYMLIQAHTGMRQSRLGGVFLGLWQTLSYLQEMHTVTDKYMHIHTIHEHTYTM